MFDLSNLTAVANAFIDLDDQIKALKDQQDILRDAIIAAGCDRIAGDTKDIQVYLSQRKVIDEDKLQRIFNVTAEQLKAFNACKKDGDDFRVVKIVNKK